jgi:glycosyltransferase involved in cell wall biosynthesis
LARALWTGVGRSDGLRYAFDRGSVREIIDDGETGFIVKDEAGAVEVFKQIEKLSRAKIRSRFEEHFTVRRMANDYLLLYEDLIEVAKPVSRLSAGGVAMESHVRANAPDPVSARS